MCDTREVSLYVITYENPYVVRAGERGQLSYINLSTDFRRKALSYVGSSVGLLKYLSHFPHLSMATFKPRETQRTHNEQAAAFEEMFPRAALTTTSRMREYQLRSNEELQREQQVTARISQLDMAPGRLSKRGLLMLDGTRDRLCHCQFHS